ncbi:hypothetical protein [Fodinicurvata fenggangensis]|uniref:hypothetical protein n=1 Tax=Fodinicurvata fenggangensis TaxID=1121830 RepID=UPI00047E3F60|nr:hypothetical protein [Fodinicurvata fenggangensis]
MMPELLHYGGVPVPWTVAWTAEEDFFLDACPYAGGRLAICQKVERGEGKPRFGSPHVVRQRAAIAHGRCDLCGRLLKTATKVSLSQARPYLHAFKPGDILQVEPLLHKRCAAICMEHCPSLRSQEADGSLHIRQVLRWQAQFALYSEQGVFEACGERRQAISHAKVQLIKWIDRDRAWLGGVA